MRPTRMRPTRQENGTTLYYCGTCDQYLAAHQYYASSSSPDGIRSNCRQCHADRQALRDAPIARHPHVKREFSPSSREKMRMAKLGTVGFRPAREIDGVVHYECLVCHKAKRKDEFGRDRRNSFGFRARCKDCINRQKSVNGEAAHLARVVGDVVRGRVTIDRTELGFA